MVNISIIVVTWNNKNIISACLDSLFEADNAANLEIIVADNDSTDGTADFIREKYPQVELICNSQNLGFAKANNLGIRRATGELICLINSDVAVPADCVSKMVSYMQNNPAIGMLGPRMLLKNGTIGQSCMRFPTIWNQFCRALGLDTLFPKSKLFGGFLMTDFRYDRIEEVDILTGWFWMVRREALNQVGLLDERYFFYGEDMDWSKRFHDAGWRVVFYPEAEAYHNCAASSSKAPTRFYVEMNRANSQYFQIHHGRLARVGYWAVTGLHQLVRIIGYSFAYLLSLGRSSEAGFKVRRSAACMRWLMGI